MDSLLLEIKDKREKKEKGTKETRNTYRLIGTDERDRFDVRMLADEIDSRVLAVYNVQQSWWRACPGEQIGEDHRGAWHAFRWFENSGVSTGDRDRKRPKGYHRREIEGTDGGSYAKGKFVGNYVHICGDVWRALPHLKRRNRDTRVHHLCNINQCDDLWFLNGCDSKGGRSNEDHCSCSRLCVYVCLCLRHLSRSESMMDYSNKYNLLYIYIFLINLRKPRRTSPSASAIVFPFSLTMFSAISF